MIGLGNPADKSRLIRFGAWAFESNPNKSKADNSKYDLKLN
jgi:hypothetical protein